MKEGQSAVIEKAVAAIEKQFGKGAIMRLGKDEKPEPIETISTGATSIDIALGVGGVPKGRVVEIYGPESSGKTTLTLHLAAECQKAGGVVAFVDAEHALDTTYAKSIGVDLSELLVSQPDTGEQALDIVDMLTKTGAVDLIIVDSVAALTPRAEIEGDMGDHHVGLQARLMSQALRKLTGNIARSGTTVVFINQIRMKIGVMFGSPETTTGGNALKFYSSVRMDIRRIASIKRDNQVQGNRVRVKVVKNKVSAPFREAELDIAFGRGFSKEGDLLDLAVEKEIVKKAGTWFSYEETRLGQGRESAKEYLLENSELCNEIEGRVREAYGLRALKSAMSGAKKSASSKSEKSSKVSKAAKPAKVPKVPILEAKKVASSASK